MKHEENVEILRTSMTGGGEGGVFSACLTINPSRRISVPAGGPST